ncbi:MAG: hypothetical protein R6X33_17500 [Candidatus Brocadiia bacterium]
MRNVIGLVLALAVATAVCVAAWPLIRDSGGGSAPEVLYARRAREVGVPRSASVSIIIGPKEGDSRIVLAVKLRDVGGTALITEDPTDDGYLLAGGQRCPLKLWLHNQRSEPGERRYILLALVPKDTTQFTLLLPGRDPIPLVASSRVSRRFKVTEL